MAKRKKLKEGVDYILTEYIDNSAPCGKCVFLYLRYGDAKCTFPKRKKKKCKHDDRVMARGIGLIVEKEMPVPVVVQIKTKEQKEAEARKKRKPMTTVLGGL